MEGVGLFDVALDGVRLAVQLVTEDALQLALAAHLPLSGDAAVLAGQYLGPEQGRQGILGDVFKYLLVRALLANLPDFATVSQLELAHRSEGHVPCLDALGGV